MSRRRKSLSIKPLNPGRAKGLGRAVTARARPGKSGSASDSEFIHESYTAQARMWDFLGLPDKPQPAYAPERKPYRDPAGFPVRPSPDLDLHLAKLKWLTAFRAQCRAEDAARAHAYELAVAARVKPVSVPIPPEPGKCPLPAKVSEAERNRALRHAMAVTHARELAEAAAAAQARADALA